MNADLQLMHDYARGRDAEAFSALVGRYQGLVYATCLRILGDQASAEDAAQECFLSLAREAGSIHTSPAGWLHRRARRAALDAIQQRRARARREKVYGELKGATGRDPTWDEVGPLIDQALDELPEELRIVLVEHFLRRRTQAELAEEMRLSPATLSRRVNAGIDAIRKNLKRMGVAIVPAVLLALIVDHASAAVPATLTGALGKMAIAGLGKATPVTASTTGTAAGIGLKVKIAASIAAAAIAVGGVTTYIVTERMTEPIPPTKGGSTNLIQPRDHSGPIPLMKGQEAMMVEAIEITRAFMLVLGAMLADGYQQEVQIDLLVAGNGIEQEIAYVAKRTENGFDLFGPAPAGGEPQKLYEARRQTVAVAVPANVDPSKAKESVLSVTQVADGKVLQPPVRLEWSAATWRALNAGQRPVLTVLGKEIVIEQADGHKILLRGGREGETYVVHNMPTE